MKKTNVKSKALFYSLMLSIVLMSFPVVSGIIVAVNNMEVPQSYWVQGAFMLLSVTVPVGILLITGVRPSQIGFVGMRKGSLKTVLYFIPVIMAKAGFLFFGINHDIERIIALTFFTAAIGLSEEIYFRGIILKRVKMCFSIKQTVLLSSILFATVHASQAFSGEGFVMVTMAVLNSLIFGIVAAEIVILTGSLIPAMIWHTLYNFINWVSPVQGTTEIILIVVQSIALIAYGIYLWRKLYIIKL